MNLCSCIVYTRPGQGAEVGARLIRLPGVEIHGGLSQGTLIVTVEDTALTRVADTLTAIGAVAGVLHSVLIYHYGDPESAQPIPSEESPP